MNRLLVAALIVFSIAGISSGISNISLSNQLAVAQRDIDRLATAAQDAADSAAIDSANAARALARAAVADSARLVRDRQLVRLQAELAAATTQADSAILASPDVCDIVVAALRNEVQKTAAVARGFETQYHTEVMAHNETKSALGTAQRDLAQAAIRLATIADDADEISVRPGFLTRILPKTGVGAFAGVSSEGKPVVGLGVTLGWRISL